MSDQHGLTRRQLLGTAATGALLFGFPFRAWGDDEKATQELKSALYAMGHLKQAGVAIVVPENGAAELGARLQKLIPSDYSSADKPARAAARLFLEAVWVCVPGSLVGAKKDETAVLIDAYGKRLAGATVDFSTPEKFVESARKLLNTEGRRDARVKAAREAGEKDLVERLAVEGADNTLARTGETDLEEHFAEWAPALFDDLPEAEKKGASAAIERVAHSHFEARVMEGKELPFGVSWELKMNTPAPCPPCGMARPTIEGRKFLDFLTKSE